MKIVHIADTHIHNTQRHDVFRLQFNKIYSKISELKPDKIVIVGDTLDNFVDITNEAKLLAGDFLTELSNIADVICVEGNHEIMKRNLNRINSIKTLIDLMKNPKIKYLEKSGFYEEDEVIFVNYSHSEKHLNIDPWNSPDITIPKNVDTKPTIGLYHDPIYNSRTYLGMSFVNKTYKPVSYFSNNDYLLLGDIHMLSYFRDNKSAAYCSSPIQNDFGEDPINHGFILWDIKSKTEFTSTFYDIPNEYNFINLYIKKGYNYDKINLNDANITQHSQIKIHWCDYSSAITNENETKIRQYIKDTFGIDGVRIERTLIKTNMDGLEIVNESVIDISDKDTQKNIFKEYLDVNKYDADTINKVLKIDEDINSRITVVNNVKNVTWNIDKLTGVNFKSYDNFDIDFTKVRNLIQISGLNRGGKSTILDAISYVLYGSSNGTEKREKNGDARFINKRRKLDFCTVSCVLDINGEKYTIVRKTERKWSKVKTITSAPTNVEIYKGSEEIEENKLTGEQRKDTDRFIANIIGDYASFRRLIQTTADDLNDSLSRDKSKFLDELIADIGLDVFDQKLTEFKEYKKEETKDFININIDDKEVEIENIKTEILTKEEDVLNVDVTISDIETEISQLQNKKEETLKTLHNIDPEIEKINVDELQEDIISEQESIDDNKVKIVSIEELKKDIKDFDETKIDVKQTEINLLNTKITVINKEISDVELASNKLSNKIDGIKNDIKTLKDKYKNEILLSKKDIENNILNIKKDFVTLINTFTSDLKDELNLLNISKSETKSKLDNLMNDGKNLKIKNEELEKSKVCTMCERTLEEHHIHIIGNTINTNKAEMISIKSKIDELNPILDELTLKIDSINSKLLSLTNKDYSFDEKLNETYLNTKNKLNLLKEDIIKKDELLNNFDSILPVDLKTQIDLLEKEISNINKDIVNNTNVIKSKNTIIDELNTSIGELNKSITVLKAEKKEIDIKKEKINTIPVIELSIEKSKNKIKEYETLIKSRTDLDGKIHENVTINIKIKDISIEIYDVSEELKAKNEEKSKIISNIAALNDRIININNDIDEFREQKKKEDILNLYGKCVHRDGLPSFLLKKSIGIINTELSNLLSLVDFTVYFDDDLRLMMSTNDRMDISQEGISCSGMERTFIACVLKIALRKINNKSKPNILIFDEITGKLDSDSIVLFSELLEVIKKEVDKLIIIEHHNNINYDVLISVKKNKEGISSLEIVY